MRVRRQQINPRAVNTWQRFVASAHGKEGPALLPPKADRIRRADGKPLQPSEHQLQSAVISWWKNVHGGYGLPYFALFAIPNGGARDVITGSRLKDEGVRRGTPDLMLAVPRGNEHGLFIEMKAGSKQPSDEQEDFLKFLQEQRYRTRVERTTEGAMEAIREYLACA